MPMVRNRTLMDRFDIAEWVVTSGSTGGCIHVRGGQLHPYRPAPIDISVDPTGAGDVFLAAYTAGGFAAASGGSSQPACRVALREHAPVDTSLPHAWTCAHGYGSRIGEVHIVDNKVNEGINIFRFGFPSGEGGRCLPSAPQR